MSKGVFWSSGLPTAMAPLVQSAPASTSGTMQ